MEIEEVCMNKRQAKKLEQRILYFDNEDAIFCILPWHTVKLLNKHAKKVKKEAKNGNAKV